MKYFLLRIAFKLLEGLVFALAFFLTWWVLDAPDTEELPQPQPREEIYL